MLIKEEKLTSRERERSKIRVGITNSSKTAGDNTAKGKDDGKGEWAAFSQFSLMSEIDDGDRL